ncbi:unnamed protein product [Pylaiella littoralis]
MQSPGELARSRGGSDRASTRSESQSDIANAGRAVAPKPNTLDHSILASAISSGMPTFLLTKGVPIIDRRAKKLVTAKALARAHRKNVPPRSVDYPPEKPACLRGHTPTTTGPSKVRVKPQRSVRGPRGVANIQDGMFKKPGVLGGLDVSPWVVEEEIERAQRAVSHTAAIAKNPMVFRRKREEGGLLDYAEEMHTVKRFLDKIHPIRDESCAPKSGFSYRRISHETEPPDFYDTRLDSVRPRTLGYSSGHVRALSPTPCLTWGGRESSRQNMNWGEGTGGSLGTVEACLEGTIRGGGSATARLSRSSPPPLQRSRFGQSWGTDDDFVSRNRAAGDERSPRDEQEPEAIGSGIEVRPMWSRQGLRPTPPEASFFHGAPAPAPAPAPALRPFSSSCDQLGRAMSREVLSRSTAGLKPQQFDTTQRRCEYACALVGKREARLLRKAGEEVASKVGEERRKNAAEEQEGIEKFEASLKEILAQKWKYL